VADPLRIVLVTPRNPLNIGAAARAMSNFGFTQMRLVNPYEVAFKEARSAVNAGYILEKAEVFQTVGEAVADCSLVAGTTAAARRDLHLPLYRLEPAGELLREHLAADKPAAILFGSEKFGLSNDDMSHCQWLFRIPSREEHGSMNLGQAVAICLYELRRDAQAAAQRFAPAPTATAEDLERITLLMLDVVRRSGYLNPSTNESSELKMRRLIRRLGVPAGDTATWLGIFRQILWKIGKIEAG
jgi:TrmH family RNA methyltransferase